MRKVRASITIYLLLSLLIVTGLVFTLTESARVHGIQARLKGLTFQAADSCFAEYSREIFERYGIMALWKSEAQFTADYDSYLQHNLSLSDIGQYRDVDLFLIRHQASALKEVQWLTDDGGSVFIQQVCDYMKYYIVKETLEELLQMLGLFEEGNKIAAFVDKINSYKEVFLQVADTVSAIQKHVDKARGMIANPKTILGNMGESMEQYAQTGNILYVARFNLNYWILGGARDEMLGHMEAIRENTELYAVQAAEAQEAVSELRSQLKSDTDAYSEETLDALQNQLDLLEQKTADPRGDYYRVTENKETAAGYAEDLIGLDQLLYSIDPTQMREHILEHREEVAYYNAVFEEFDLNRLGLEHTSERVKRENAGFLSTVRDVFTKGLMKAIVGTEVSDRKIDTRTLPSVTVNRKSSGNEKEGLLSIPYRRMLLAEYMAGHFGNYCAPQKDTALTYEMEYALCGKASDKENLKTVIRELVLLRAGLNMISLMRDHKKMREAELLALAIIGFTGIEPLVEMVKMVIVSIWCLAEALCDAKTLTGGGKIPVIKEGHQWAVTVTGLKNFSKSVLPAANQEEGLDYTGYLKVMLLGKSNATLAFRAMDLIQANACEWYEPAFRMDSCINCMTMETAFDTRQLFAAFLFVRKLTGSSRGTYGFLVEQSYTYTGS